MTSSKDLGPSSSPFFPTIFIKNQFRSEPLWPSKDTDLSGKVAAVTGANVGLGLETADQLLALKLSHLILAVRSTSKGEAAAKSLRAKYPKATIDVFEVDMLSYDSIQAFAARLDGIERLDIVILNAGIRNAKHELASTTQHEMTVQVNYISTSLLAILLLPILKRKAVGQPGRLTIVGSGLSLQTKFKHRAATPLLPSFDDPKNFDPRDRYNVTKLLGLMFLYKLEEYVSADDVVVNVVDPGFVKGTSLSRDISGLAIVALGVFKTIAARTLKVGASTYVDAAVVKGKDSHGCYIMSWEICSFADIMYTPEGKEITERLWSETIAELGFANVQDILNDMKRK